MAPRQAADPTPWCLALVGPTASGKSAAAMAIARRLPSEIISVDSALVYRGMNIGTAKPTRLERSEIVHHLIDIRDPLDAYSAAEFVRDAGQLVEGINTRGKLALLVGGTMLYVKALIDGLNDMPPADRQVRAALEQEAAASSWPAMHARLALVDPVTAARLAPNDSQRIQRALEVHRLTGRPLSDLHRDGKSADAPSRFADLPLLSLEPRQRDWLHGRIAHRFDAMLDAGFLDEVRALRARSDLHPDLPSMRCVGYRQAWQALDNAFPMAQLRERGIVSTRQLAKRQLTWLRSMPQRRVIACDDDDSLAQLVQAGLDIAAKATP